MAAGLVVVAALLAQLPLLAVAGAGALALAVDAAVALSLERFGAPTRAARRHGPPEQRPGAAGQPGPPGASGGERPLPGQHPPAEAPEDAAGAIFCREGEYWTIAFTGPPFRLRDTKGLRFIHHLLSHPGREFHVMDLVVEVDRLHPDPPATKVGARLPKANEAVEGLHHDREEALLDARGKELFRRRLEDLREQVEEGRAWGDADRVARAQKEIDAISEELARSVGLGRRDRRTASDAERARVNVTRTIKAVVQKIEEEDVPLARHLAVAIHTGRFCSYAPDPSPDPSNVPTWHL